MNIRVFKKNGNKIEFTTNELTELLNEVYNDGYHDGENHAKYNYFTWSPSLNPTLNGPTCSSTHSMYTDTNSLTIADSNSSADSITVGSACSIGTAIPSEAMATLSCFPSDVTLKCKPHKLTMEEIPAFKHDIFHNLKEMTADL